MTQKLLWTFFAIAAAGVTGALSGAAAYAQPNSGWPGAIGSGVPAGLLAATFVAILWYSCETRNLLEVSGLFSTSSNYRPNWIATLGFPRRD